MIQLKHINKTYKDFSLTDINLCIKDNECVIIKGVSGSGKSTILHMIAGLLKPNSGAVLVNGENIAMLSDIHLSNYRAEHIGFVTQEFYLFENIDVSWNVSVALLNKNIKAKKIEEMSNFAMKKANIFHKANHLARELSGGEKQRCIIARAIVNEPDILLCDEPTANLDKSNKEMFLKLITEFYKDGKTIVIATHDDIFDTLDFAKTIKIEDGQFR